jgi:hypothetical protein
MGEAIQARVSDIAPGPTNHHAVQFVETPRKVGVLTIGDELRRDPQAGIVVYRFDATVSGLNHEG